MRPNRGTVVLALLLAAGLLAACGHDDEDAEAAGGVAPSASDLDGRTFVSDDVEGQTLVEGSTISLTFAGSSVTASAGCNSQSGTYSIEDGTLTVAEPLAATQMACPDDLTAQDVWIGELLTGGAAVTLDGDTLTLAGDGVTVVATASG